MKLKYLKLFAIAFLGLILGVLTVKADVVSVTVEKTLYYRSYKDSYMASGGRTGNWYTYTIDNKNAYCIEPNIDTSTDSIYQVEAIPDHDLDDDTIKMIRLMAYYGYDYPGHSTTNYKMATQKLIWETAAKDSNFPGRVFDFIDFYETDGVTARSVLAEENEIKRLVNTALTIPSFNQSSVVGNIGETIEIIDSNGVLLEGFVIDNDTDCGNGKATCKIVDNKLTVISNVVGDLNIGVKKEFNEYMSNSEVFYNSNVQDLVTAGKYPTTYVNVNVKSNGGKIRINKIDAQNNSNVPQGEATLVGAKYGIYNSKGTLVTTLVMGDNCSAISDYLPYGTYTIKEIEASVGYLLDTNTYTAVINSSTLLEVTVKENVIEGQIKIYKYDIENNSCKALGEGTLVGAKYGIYDKNSILVDTLTIGNGCVATSRKLPFGTYTIKEITSSVGYLLDSNSYKISINSTMTYSVTSKEQVIKGQIELQKVDSETNTAKPQGEASLRNAKYGIYDNENNLAEILVTNELGYAISKLLPFGNYTIRELESSIGYELDAKVYLANITEKKIYNVESKEQVIKGQIELQKVDSETNMASPEGQASLENAKYGVYNKDNILVDTLVTNKKGYAISKLLPFGSYTIRELESSIGYEIDANIYRINVIEVKTYNVISKEKIINNFISILKQYDYVDGNTTFLNAEAGIIFEVFYPDGRKYDEIITDKKGYATLEIPYGVWRIHQKNTNAGFGKIYDFYITVDESSEKDQYYNILNNKLAAYLQVFKTDFETGEVIAISDTTFKILNTDTNSYVSQYVGGKVYSEFKTDDEGKFITYLKLEAGNYKLIEVKSPDHYLLNTEGLPFSIGNGTHYEYTKHGAIVTIYFSNKVIKGQIEINKTGEFLVINDGKISYEEKPLENIVFEIYAKEDVLSADGKHLYYEKNQLVDTLITNKNGYAISKELYLGLYNIVEVKTSEYHVLDNMQYEVILSQSDNITPIVYYKFSNLNELKKGILEFTKISDKESLSDALIEIYTENNELIFNGMTNKNGQIIINEIPYGKYYILEKKSPDGYLLNEEKIYFEIKENKEIIKIRMEDERVEGIIKIHKDGENYYNFENGFRYEKKDNIEGIKFGLYAREDIILNNIVRFKSGDLVSEGCTDKNGNLVFKSLYLGKYFIKEIETKDGYTLDKKEYDVELKYVGFSVVERNIILNNYLIKGDLEFVKADSSNGKLLPNALIEIYNANGKVIYQGYTGNDGKIILKNVPVGKYYLIEKEAPESYVVNNEYLWFEIKDDGEIVYVSMMNRKIEGILEFVKTDLITGEVIPNTLIEIYNDKDVLVYQGKTDGAGKIKIENLSYGKYYIVEKVPTTGYMLTDERVYFEIKIDGEIVKANMTNKLITSMIRIHKVDEFGNKVTGVEIGVFDLDNNLIGTYVSDKDGHVKFELGYGSYYYKELKTVDGYALNDEKVYFNVINDGETMDFSLVNVQVVDTSLDEARIFDIASILLIIIGFRYLLWVRSVKNGILL